MYIRKIRVPHGLRAVVLVDERPARYLIPGAHWVVQRRGAVTIEWIDATNTVANLRSDVAELVPASELRVLRLAEHERAIVHVRGVPMRWLGAGEHQVWVHERSTVRGEDGSERVVDAVEIEVFDTSDVTATPLSGGRDHVASDVDYSQLVVPEGFVALRHVDGVLESILDPGRHAAWTTVRDVSMTLVDLRERLVQVTGQEVMTKDRVSLRLNLSATYRVADARRMATVAREPDSVLYLAVQLAAREAVSSRTLDELLATRDALAGSIAEEVERRAESVGLAVVSVDLRDMILPGDMRSLLNRVIEAQKEAEANVILRREEASATRSLAQTAKVLADNPVLLRLKELEAYRDLADKVGEVHVVLGEGAVPQLQLRGR